MINFLKKVTPFQIVFILFFAGCLICGLPFSRDIIISFMEKLIGRSLNDMTKWNAVITGTMAFFACCTVFIYYFLYIPLGKKSFSQIKADSIVFFKADKFLKYFGIACAVLFIAYFTIIRANFDFADDTKRIISGHKSWVGASRYVSETLSILLHTNFYLNDISPLTNFVTISILALSAVLLCFIFTGKFTFPTLAASILFAISPFYIENFSYKFDSPYMAMAMFFGILPFLYRNNLIAFGSASVVSLILVLTSYQAGNSIFIILAIFTVLLMISHEDKASEIGKFILISILSYIIAMIVFRAFVMIPTEATISERNTQVGLTGMISLLKSNFVNYTVTVLSRFGNLWIKFFTLICVVLFPIAGAKSVKNKTQGALFSIAALVMMFTLSFGAYLIIGNTVIADRAFMGFDVLISVIALYDVMFICGKKTRILAVTSVFCLLYGFIVQTTISGNFYAKQQKYEDFRYTLLLNDLNQIIDQSAKNSLLLDGNIGNVNKNHMDYKNYPFADIGGLSSGWAKYYFQNYNFDADYLQIEASSSRIEQKPEFKALKENLPLIKETYYHTIKGKDNVYYIYFKNVSVKEYE